MRWIVHPPVESGEWIASIGGAEGEKVLEEERCLVPLRRDAGLDGGTVQPDWTEIIVTQHVEGVRLCRSDQSLVDAQGSASIRCAFVVDQILQFADERCTFGV